jgi:hypothetical protein
VAEVAARVDDEALWRDIAGRLADWQAILERQPIQARQILRKLLAGRLTFTPLPDLAGYEIRGQASYGKLLGGLVPAGGTTLFRDACVPSRSASSTESDLRDCRCRSLSPCVI